MKEQVFPKNCRGIIDITKAPYYADNTGKNDVTKILCKAIDDVVKVQIDGIDAVYEKLEKSTGDTIIGFENRKINGKIHAIFPEYCDPTPTIYLPDGIYRVSDTIGYSFEKLQNFSLGLRSKGMELAAHIRILGQSQEKTVIRLDDGSHGFEFGQHRAVLDIFRGDRSNVAMSNYVENLTIDIGKNNPGAIGLIFFANNSGAVRSVKISSSDQEGRGDVGFLIQNEIVSGCFVRDLTVEGFTTGIKVIPVRNFTVFEEIKLKNQLFYGMEIQNTICSICRLSSENRVPGLYVSGPAAHVVLTNSDFYSDVPVKTTAIRIDMGCVLLRSINTKNYASSFVRLNGVQSTSNDFSHFPDAEPNIQFNNTAPDGFIDEFTTHGVQHLFVDKKQKGINLRIPSIPDARPIEDLNEWACVSDYGALGDGKHDDTEAIQEAMNSGFPVVWFQPGQYFISKPILVPSSVRHIHGMFSDIALSEEMINTQNQGVFTLAQNSDDYLVIEKFLTWEQCYGNARFIRQDCKRTLLMKDIHTQTLNCYFNTVAGSELFFENVAATSGGTKYRHIPCFEFHGQTVWCHHINPERSEHEIINDGGQVWVMGFKTEGSGPLVETVNGITEVLGGIMSIGKNSLNPIVLSEDSDVSVTCSTNAYSMQQIYPVAVTEIRNKEARHMMRENFPVRFEPTYYIPLFTGYGNKKIKKQNYSFELY